MREIYVDPYSDSKYFPGNCVNTVYVPIHLPPAACEAMQSLNKPHALHTVINRRKTHLRERRARVARVDGFCGLAVEIGEGFEQAFRVAARRAAEAGDVGGQAWIATTDGARARLRC